MPITKARAGEIALLVLADKMSKDGITLKPLEVKREAKNLASRLGISVHEAAEMIKMGITEVFEKTVVALDQLINNADDGLCP